MTLDKLAAAFACGLLDKGGFAAWEQPQLLSQEVRTGFRSLSPDDVRGHSS